MDKEGAGERLEEWEDGRGENDGDGGGWGVTGGDGKERLSLRVCGVSL